MMETVFYDDNAAHHNNNYFTAGMNLNQLKRKMTLDLNSGGLGGNGKQTTVIKKARVASLNTPLLSGPAVLSSPDLHKLNMSSPEFEKFVIQQTSTLPTPTPSQNQIFFPKNVTEEQEQYVRGFTDALSKLQQQKNAETNNNNNNSSNNIPIIVSTSNNTITNNNNNNNNIITIHTSTVLQPPQQQLVQTTTTAPSTNNSSNIHLLSNPPQQQQQIQLQLIHQQQPPPPPYTFDPETSSDASDDDDNDSMSENSCSNSTTSSSTYTTNGHVAVPGNFSGQHRLPEYQMSMGATGTSGNIPVSAATIGSYVQIKEEPHGSSAPVSPIDMQSQEKIKLERKRQRNRVAASKCRKRKLERISKLEDKVKLLKGENSDLTNVLTKLRETVSSLKQQVIEHINSGCQITGLTNQIVTSSSF